MQILCNSIETASCLLGETLSWTECETSRQNLVVQALFPESERLYQSGHSLSDWNLLCITRHTRKSQFSTLAELLRNKDILADRYLSVAGSGENFKGYRDRSWVSQKGNIHLSLILQSGMLIEHFEVGFTIMAVVSVIQALDEIPELKAKCMIRWVNDLVIGTNKVGGVIAYSQGTGKFVSGVVIGVGLNVETTPLVETDIFVPQVASLNDYTSCKLRTVFLPLLIKLRQNYNMLLSGQYETLLDFYRSRSAVLDREVTIYSDPRAGKPEEIATGKVTQIGDNLELYLSGQNKPIFSGRLIIKN